MRRRRSKAEMLADDADVEKHPKVIRPLTENHISRILNNPFYTGRIKLPSGEHVVSTSHEALVSDEQFDEVQQRLAEKTVSLQYTDKLALPLRGYARCLRCKRVYTPYTKKGILYFAARCRSGCTNPRKNWNIEKLNEFIREALQALPLDEKELAQLNDIAEKEIREVERKRQIQTDRSQRNRGRIENELRYLERNRLQVLTSGLYTPEELLEEKNRLEQELREQDDVDAVSVEELRDMVYQVKTTSELLENLVVIYDSATMAEKERIARAAFSELYISENTPQYKAVTELRFFSERFSATGWPIGC